MDVAVKLEMCHLTTQNQTNVPLDLTFHDICYTVGKGKNVKNILHQMNGTFKSGQLTAILGPSGAGKSSLMNILAGFKTIGVDGRVNLNGVERNLKMFRKQSAYIEQYDHLLQNLTVGEYMNAAAHLKLGNGVSQVEKKSNIELVMKTLGLSNNEHIRISRLSGGECKRLSIGVELFDNPAILFLDEPTSGLDSSSTLQCVALLREIARSGRTVVATIHQPSSRLLDHFDHLYIVASGSCIYQGPPGSLVPYLKTVNLNCPSYTNPADFVLDVASGEYGDVLPQLTSGIKNGRIIYEDPSIPPLATPSLNRQGDVCEDENEDDVEKMKNRENRLTYATPFHTQVSVLLERTWRSIWREKMLTQVRFTTHILFGIFFGLLYQAVGNDAAFTLNNAGMLYFNLIFIVFTSVMPTVVTFPLERKVLIREHLNNWYSLKAYYLAKLLADIPFQIIFPTVYLVIVYFMTGQPLSLQRFSMLLCITIFTSLVGQGIGLVVGAVFDIQSAAFMAPTFAIPFLLFAGFFINFKSIPSYMNWMTYLSFFRYGFEGSMLAIYDYDRPPLDCSEPYCHFRFPQKFLEKFDMAHSSYSICVFGMVVYFVVMRVAGYFLLRFKVYLIPAFFMSNQPLCIERFSMLLAIIITMSMVGQGIGLFFGATFDIPVASYFTPISCIPFLLVSGFMLKFNAIPSYLSWITYLSFLHYGFEGSMLTIYDRERPPLSCSQSYCHFRYPVKFLEQFDLTQSSYFLAIVGMRILFYRDTSGWLLRVAFQIAAHTFSRYSFILLFHLSFICVVHRTSHPLLINKKN